MPRKRPPGQTYDSRIESGKRYHGFWCHDDEWALLEQLREVMRCVSIKDALVKVARERLSKK